MFGLFRGIRRLIRLATLILIVLLLFWLYRGIREDAEAPSDRAVSAAPREYTAYNPERMHAMWLSQFDLSPILLEGDAQRDEEDFRARAERVMINLADSGFNTVFLQVRPNGDSLYPSELFPSSPYAVGEIGRTFRYDPFAILLELAHKEGLSVHAWINPYRLYSEKNLSLLSEEYVHAAWCREDSDRAETVNGVWYLNPAYPEAAALVAEGVEEILTLYEVDGIHIDDYFYPTTDIEFDREAFSLYGEGRSLGDFRRDSVSMMVKTLYETVHEAGGGRIFGVSPGGNTERNLQVLYADVEAWCAETGYLDYLCPQVYFGLLHESHPFLEVCREFSDMIRGDGIRLCIGMTMGKAYNGYYGRGDAYAGSGGEEWIEHRDILLRCVELTETLPHCDGVAFFSYQYFFSPQNGLPVDATEEERSRLIPRLKEKLKSEKNF